MTHKNISSAVAAAMNMEPSLAKSIEGAMTKTLLACCCNMDDVAIPGFGTFSPEKNDERVVTDSEGKNILLPPSIELKWHPSVMLRKHLLS